MEEKLVKGYWILRCHLRLGNTLLLHLVTAGWIFWETPQKLYNFLDSCCWPLLETGNSSRQIFNWYEYGCIMFSPACSATPPLVLSVISFLPYLLCNWGPGGQKGLPLPFLDKSRKQEVVSFPLLARSWWKKRKEKPRLHPKESWGIWTALNIRHFLSAPCFLLCSLTVIQPHFLGTVFPNL